jgi:hypothetical protein
LKRTKTRPLEYSLPNRLDINNLLPSTTPYTLEHTPKVHSIGYEPYEGTVKITEIYLCRITRSPEVQKYPYTEILKGDIGGKNLDIPTQWLPT